MESMATVVSKVIVTTMWYNSMVHTIAIICSNNHLGSHCCNSVLQRWPQFPWLRQKWWKHGCSGLVAKVQDMRPMGQSPWNSKRWMLGLSENAYWGNFWVVILQGWQARSWGGLWGKAWDFPHGV
jgi:hypothetical protein